MLSSLINEAAEPAADRLHLGRGLQQHRIQGLGAVVDLVLGSSDDDVCEAFNDVSSTKQNWSASIAVVASNAANSIDGVLFSTGGP